VRRLCGITRIRHPTCASTSVQRPPVDDAEPARLSIADTGPCRASGRAAAGSRRRWRPRSSPATTVFSTATSPRLPPVGCALEHADRVHDGEVGRTAARGPRSRCGCPGAAGCAAREHAVPVLSSRAMQPHSEWCFTIGHVDDLVDLVEEAPTPARRAAGLPAHVGSRGNRWRPAGARRTRRLGGGLDPGADEAARRVVERDVAHPHLRGAGLAQRRAPARTDVGLVLAACSGCRSSRRWA